MSEYVSKYTGSEIDEAIGKVVGGLTDAVSPTASVKQTADGATISITDKDGTTTATIRNGVDGKDGSAGAPGAPGAPGADGSDGVGVSNIYQKTTSIADGGENVYVIELTDGTVSNFKVRNGSKGSAGADGNPGADGKDGASVTVKSVSTSTADGGSNVVTFSDGKTLTVKNGSKGSAGAAGKDGADGYAPVKGVDYFDGNDGAPGADGYTPVKGVDYYTEADKAEFSEYIASELAKRNQLVPEFANSKDDCTDESKLYVLPDGYIYASIAHATEGGKIPLFSNLLENASCEIKHDVRYSHSSAAFVSASNQACDSVIIPIPTSGNVTIRFKGLGYHYYNNGSTSYTNVYTGKDKVTFGTNTGITGANMWLTDDPACDYYFTFNNSAGDSYLVFMTNKPIADDAIVTVNQPIEYETVAGGISYVWESTGHAFVPADYEERIIASEEAIDDLGGRVSALESGQTDSAMSALSMMVYAPSPQLPADGSDTADFDATNITADEIYTYIDALVDKYPQYLTKETLGKDESGTFDWNRYTASRRTYDAWVKPTHPAMYAWVSGSTVIYSVSVSPRIGDAMYTTAYIGTAYSTVTAVDTPNQTRTVNGLVFSRDKSKDVVPTLVYTQADYNPYRLGVYATWHNNVYNASRTRIGTIASIADGVLTDSNGNTYNRYPMGDADSNLKRLPVLVIGSNEHGGNGNGDPAEPAIISARLIKDLCECRNADNPFLNLLKSEYMIVFCPLINPWGYGKDNGYVNANGVNLDRNFDTPGWGNDTDTRHGAYGGSENETQYFMNTLYESGTKIALANHGLGDRLNPDTGEAVSAGMCSYMFGSNNAKYTAHLASIAETMNVNYGLSFYDMNQAPGDTYGKTRSYMDYIGIEGGAVEMSAIDGYLLHGGARHTARILEADYTLLLQFLHMLIECQE